MNYKISIRSYGEHAILIEWPNQVEEAILEDILSFQEYLISTCLNLEEWELIPTYNSLTLIYRKKVIVFDVFKTNLEQWYSHNRIESTKERFLWKLPVCYDVPFGVDLEETSQKLQISVKEIINLHTRNSYTVYGIGFLPGFMYLGGLSQKLEIVRRETPRLKVEKGSVGLAGKQTGIYPQDSPGGWNIIGNCPISLFDSKKENPCFASVGDKVQFYEIKKEEYNLIKIENEVGVFNLKKSILNA